jgi:hypothetical protein
VKWLVENLCGPYKRTVDALPFDQDLNGRGFRFHSMDTRLKRKTDVQIANLCDRLPNMVLQKSMYLTAKCCVIKY